MTCNINLVFVGRCHPARLHSPDALRAAPAAVRFHGLPAHDGRACNATATRADVLPAVLLFQLPPVEAL